MDAERWGQVERFYHAALEHEPGRRSGFLAEACKGDEELRSEVESLLAQDRSGPGVLDRAAWEGTATLLENARPPQLAPGAQLGPYRIESLIGAGGMGKVYKACDIRLGRAVAIKFSAKEFSNRFEREARTISALNHPHICTLYDIGPNYLVMELVDGETLAARLRKGALSIDLVLQYGTQIADALAVAHSQGIVHRDLKPANIVIKKSGVKVLDFGLAKSPRDETLTASHAVMGTPAYMAPEQREGAECDGRADIFALGLVLHEMATGKRPVQDQPGSSDGLPVHFVHVIERCLEKDPADRWQAASDVKRELEWVGKRRSAAIPAALELRNKSWKYAIGAAAAVFLLMAGWLVKVLLAPAIKSPAVVRLAIPLPELNARSDPGRLDGAPAISPDGRMVVTPLSAGSDRYLSLRLLDSDKFERIPGTEEGTQPFWSPDGRQIAFFAEGKLKTVRVAGGGPVTLCTIDESGGRSRGGAWSRSGTILFGLNYLGLFGVSDRGGQPHLVAGLDAGLKENSLRFPSFLPDGNRFIYFSRTAREEDRAIYLDALDTARKRPRKRLVIADGAGGLGHDPLSGKNYLLYPRSGKLWAQEFNTDRGELTGDPEEISEDVGQFTVSSTGSLVFRPLGTEESRLTWFDRSGKILGFLGDQRDYWDVELSPDDLHVAFVNHRQVTGHFSIWTTDIERNLASPFSAQTERSFDPVWSRDGKRVYFDSPRSEGNQILSRALDDTGSERPVTAASAKVYRLRDLSADSRFLLAELREGNKKTLVYSTFGQNNWRSLLDSGAVEALGQFSPDGRRVAYQSNETGVPEIYITDFPGARQKQRVSATGGEQPRWRRDGGELFYHARDGKIMAVAVSRDGVLSKNPSVLFSALFPIGVADDGFEYAVSRDGERFLVINGQVDDRSRNLNMVFNWPQLMRHRP